jgi:hypothetical protein
VRNTEEIFEFVNDIKEVSDNINSFTSIYSDTDIKIRNIKFPEKYKISAEHADRKVITNIKNSAHP